jgi:hypothetical protein
MFMNTLSAIKAVPEEYRTLVSTLFPRDGEPPALETVEQYAHSLEIDADFKRLLESEYQMQQFYPQFKNNFSLLITKTWVGDADEVKKETLRARLPSFYDKVERRHFHEALLDFNVILEELAYLFFGDQSQRDDFTEYAFRVDTQMGLFWWYGSQLGRVATTCGAGVARALIILGMCYLNAF